MTRDSKSHLYLAGDADYSPIESEIEASNALSSQSRPPAGPICAAGPSGDPLTLDSLPPFNTGHYVIPLDRDQHWPMVQGLRPQASQNPVPSTIVDVVKIWWPDSLES